MTRTKDKRPQRLKVKAMILFQNSQCSWNTFFENYAFEFCKSAFAEEHKTFLRRNWKSKSENEIPVNILLEPFDYRINK